MRVCELVVEFSNVLQQVGQIGSHFGADWNHRDIGISFFHSLQVFKRIIDIDFIANDYLRAAQQFFAKHFYFEFQTLKVLPRLFA